jgi:hypothetical protein
LQNILSLLLNFEFTSPISRQVHQTHPAPISTQDLLKTATSSPSRTPAQHHNAHRTKSQTNETTIHSFQTHSPTPPSTSAQRLDTFSTKRRISQPSTPPPYTNPPKNVSICDFPLAQDTSTSRPSTLHVSTKFVFFDSSCMHSSVTHRPLPFLP